MLLLPMLAAAAVAAAPDDERAALAGRRQAVEQGFQAAQAACATRFAVSSCLDAARLKRRDELVALQKAEATLAARERHEASRRRADKPAAVPALAAVPGAAAAAASAAPVTPAPERPATAASAASANLEVVPPRRPGPPDRAENERRARAAFEGRQKEAESRRRQVERRNAERPSKAAPLPVPASGAGR